MSDYGSPGMAVDERFGERLKELRARHDRAGEAVAQAVGTSYRNYQRWEQGQIPRRGNQVKLADYFGVTVDDLMGRPATEPASGGVERQVAEIHRMLRELLTDDQLAEIARELAREEPPAEQETPESETGEDG